MTEYNLKQIFYQIFYGVDYKPKVKDKYGNNSKICEIVEEDNNIINKKNLLNVKVHFLTCFNQSLFRHLPNESVTIFWISNNMLDLFSQEFVKTLKNDSALILFEGIKYFPDKRKEDFENYNKKIKEFVKFLGDNVKEIQFDAAKDDFAKYLYSKIIVK